MKKFELKVIHFDNNDVIATSSETDQKCNPFLGLIGGCELTNDPSEGQLK